jgi:hypothetical protein
VVVALQMVVVLAAPPTLRLPVLAGVLLGVLAVLELILHLLRVQVQMAAGVVVAFRQMQTPLQVQFFLLKTVFIT